MNVESAVIFFINNKYFLIKYYNENSFNFNAFRFAFQKKITGTISEYPFSYSVEKFSSKQISQVPKSSDLKTNSMNPKTILIKILKINIFN